MLFRAGPIGNRLSLAQDNQSMDIWKYIAGLFRRSRPEAAPKETRGEVASGPRVGDYSAFFDVAGERSALSVATVYRCVMLLSESVANLPLQFMRLKDGIFVEDLTGRMHYLLSVQPDYTYTAFDFWAQVVSNVLLDGNAYIVPVYNPVSMELDRLALCGRHTVAHDIYSDTYTVTDTVNAIYGVYGEQEIIHIKGFSRDGKSGISVLANARLTLGIAQTGDQETLNRFANGGNVRGLVSNDKTAMGFGEYQDKELERAALSLDNRFRSGERIVSLPGQVGFQQLSLSSTDMQFLESRKFTVRDICRFFGVHPSFVFDDTSNNYKSAEMANVAFLSNTLNPLLRKIENELLRKLVAPSLSAKRKFQFDRRGLYACDLDSRVKYQTSTIAAGLYTVNEWRRQENKPPVEGGDTVLVSANLRAIKEDGRLQEVPGRNRQDGINENKEENQKDETDEAE